VVTQPAYTQISSSSGRYYLKQNAAGAFTGTSGPVSWQFQWTAPTATITALTFYVAGNAANYDTLVGGDYAYIASYDLALSGAAPPVVADIPDQEIAYGGSFSSINLDDYVDDPDTPDDQIVWTYSGNTNITVDITDRVATLTPAAGWWGSETITFTATDPTLLSDSDNAAFTVLAPLPPVVADIPDQTIYQGEYFAQIMLDDYVDDPDTPDDQITWTTSITQDITVTIVDRIATITYDTTWFGMEEVSFIATDPENNSDEDIAAFTVLEVGVHNPKSNTIPAQFSLNQNYPNPFNAVTTVSFALPRTSEVRLEIYDNTGRLLMNLCQGSYSAGYYDFAVDFHDFASGIYLLSLKAGDFSAVRKMVLLK